MSARAFPVLLIVFTVWLIFFTTSAHAQEPFLIEQIDPVVRNDFVVGPGKVELELNPGQSVETEMIVSNRMGESKTFAVTVEDMTGSQDPDTAVVLLGDDRGPYTLRDYISAPVETFTLEHGARARIPITVTLPADAEPGGKYGSVLISTISQDAEVNPETGAAARSAIIGRVGTLFFVTTPGESNAAGKMVDFYTVPDQKVFGSGPITFSVLYENTGSIHTNPYGYVSVKNLTGEEVGFVDLEPWFALPNSVRARDITWERERLFGRYEAVVEINRGYDDITDTESLVFWVINWQLISVVFGAALMLVLMLKYIRARFTVRRI